RATAPARPSPSTVDGRLARAFRGTYETDLFRMYRENGLEERPKQFSRTRLLGVGRTELRSEEVGGAGVGDVGDGRLHRLLVNPALADSDSPLNCTARSSSRPRRIVRYSRMCRTGLSKE